VVPGGGAAVPVGGGIPGGGAGFGFATESKRLAPWEPVVERPLVICDVVDT
jgi:hypothetical protein